MDTTNTFNSMKSDMKDTYSDIKKKKRFNKLKEALKNKGKATAELDASKNPMKALKDKSYLSLKGKKGIAV